MDSALVAGEADFRLTFDKQMTFAFAAELEDTILDALRRYKRIEVDLSKVKEIDLYGAHLLGLLQSFFGKGLVLVGTSPAVDKAYRRFLTPLCLARPTRPANRLGNTTAAQTKRGVSSASYEEQPQGGLKSGVFTASPGTCPVERGLARLAEEVLLFFRFRALVQTRDP